MAENVKLVRKMVLLILLVVGLGLTIGGGCWYWHVGELEKEYKPVVAKIEKIESRRSHTAGGKNDRYYYVTVSYQVDGKEYRRELSEYSSSMEIGGNVSLMYNPADPTEVCSTEVRRVLAMVMTIAGLFLLLSDWLIVPRMFKMIEANAKRRQE